MQQEIQVVAKLKICTAIKGKGYLKETFLYSIKKNLPFHLTEVISIDNSGIDPIIEVKIITEANAIYPKKRIKREITGDLIARTGMNVSSVEVISFKEEAEVYGNL